MSKKNESFGISGKGYYIALVLCAVAIAITGFLYYRNADKDDVAMQNPPAQQVDTNETPDVQAVATQPGQDATEPPYVGDGKKPPVIRQPSSSLLRSMSYSMIT